MMKASKRIEYKSRQKWVLWLECFIIDKNKMSIINWDLGGLDDGGVQKDRV